MRSSTNSGIVKVDIKGMRMSDSLDIFHMEVAGPPCKALINMLWAIISLATKIRVYSVQSINARLILYALSMLSDGRFLSEITKQEELVKEINWLVLRPMGTTFLLRCRDFNAEREIKNRSRDRSTEVRVGRPHFAGHLDGGELFARKGRPSSFVSAISTANW
ncbi:9647_t:CDS:2 [Entrophospora sp. SA101]|nr:9647_t:CDS:2 [Entrophospora sp. SA101]CAJ0828115.1 10956_t:CDS:2 [Entrophospora sp. SA101]